MNTILPLADPSLINIYFSIVLGEKNTDSVKAINSKKINYGP